MVKVNTELKAENMTWLGVDLDKTIAITKESENFDLDKIIPGAKNTLKKLEADGWKIIIYTARHWAQYAQIEVWLIANDIPFRRIICGKPLCKYYIDDRAIGFRGDWDDVYNEIK